MNKFELTKLFTEATRLSNFIAYSKLFEVLSEEEQERLKVLNDDMWLEYERNSVCWFERNVWRINLVLCVGFWLWLGWFLW